MTRAEIIGNVICVEFPRTGTSAFTRTAKEVPGARYHARGDAHADGPHFSFPLSWATCKALRGVFGAGLEVGPALTAWAKTEVATRVRPALEMRDVLNVKIPGTDPRLRGYQGAAAAFLVRARGAILADEMRLGKTPESITAARMAHAVPLLVVTPNSVKFQWEEALESWWPGVRVAVIRGSAGERRKTIARIAAGEADVGIINWESLRLHTRLAGYASVVALARCEACGGDGRVTEARCEAHERELNAIPWRAIIADEAHRAAHPRSKQARALWAVGAGAEYRWALTGTPVLDTLQDLWALGHWIAPEDYPSKTAFLERYGVLGYNVFGGLEIDGLKESTKAELFSFTDPRFLRRTREMVMPWLPEKIYATRTVELDSRQRKAYEEMRREMMTEVDDGSETYVTNALSKLTRLRQFASAHATMTGEDGERFEYPRMTMPSSKVDAMIEIAEELGGKPAVVFAESKQLINLAGAALEKAGYEIGYVTGDVDDGDRAEYVRNFQRGDLQFLLVTLGAGGEGLTLDRADVAVFLQRSFSLAKNRQAEDRIVGQEPGPGLQIIDVVAEDTVESRVLEVLEGKEERFEEIVRDRETFRRLLGD